MQNYLFANETCFPILKRSRAKIGKTVAISFTDDTSISELNMNRIQIVSLFHRDFPDIFGPDRDNMSNSWAANSGYGIPPDVEIPLASEGKVLTHVLVVVGGRLQYTGLRIQEHWGKR